MPRDRIPPKHGDTLARPFCWEQISCGYLAQGSPVRGQRRRRTRVAVRPISRDRRRNTLNVTPNSAAGDIADLRRAAKTIAGLRTTARREVRPRGSNPLRPPPRPLNSVRVSTPTLSLDAHVNDVVRFLEASDDAEDLQQQNP